MKSLSYSVVVVVGLAGCAAAPVAIHVCFECESTGRPGDVFPDTGRKAFGQDFGIHISTQGDCARR